MRVPPRLVIFLSILSLFSTSAIGCGATKAQRRTTAAITIAAGAGLLVGGLVAANTEDDDDCPAEGGVCIDLVDENAIGGRVLMLTGGVLAFVGLVGLVAAPRPDTLSLHDALPIYRKSVV